MPHVKATNSLYNRSHSTNLCQISKSSPLLHPFPLGKQNLTKAMENCRAKASYVDLFMYSIQLYRYSQHPFPQINHKYTPTKCHGTVGLSHTNHQLPCGSPNRPPTASAHLTLKYSGKTWKSSGQNYSATHIPNKSKSFFLKPLLKQVPSFCCCKCGFNSLGQVLSKPDPGGLTAPYFVYLGVSAEPRNISTHLKDFQIYV